MRRKAIYLRAGQTLHVETPLGIINIRCGLQDSDGNLIDSIEILEDKFAGEPTISLDGYHNNRLIQKWAFL